MPPAAKRNVSLILFDLKSSKKDLLLAGLMKFVTHRFLSTKDQCNLFLTNSSITNNARNVENVLRTGIDDFSVKTIFDCINTAEPSSEVPPVDLLNVLLLAIYYVKQAHGMPGVITLQIIYFTDLVCQSVQDESHVANIVQSLNEYEIFLNIIGPDVELPTTITKPDDVQKCMKGIMVDESNPAVLVAKKIVQQTDCSTISNLKLGINLALFFKKNPGTQPWAVPISIGSLLDVPAKTSKIFKDKAWKLQDISTKSYNKTFILKEDQGQEVQLDEMINGVSFHSKFIKIDSEDMFKSDTERTFALVGFTDSKFISEPYIGGDSTFHVLPGAQPGEGEYELFATLVKVLIDEDKYAIMERVYSKGNNPKYFILKPEIDEKGWRFVMTNLPYAENLPGSNYHPCSETEKPDLTKEDNIFNSFCQSMDMDSEMFCKQFPLTPSMMIDTYTETVIEEIARKLCQKDFDFQETRALDLETINANVYEDDLRQEWPQPTS